MQYNNDYVKTSKKGGEQCSVDIFSAQSLAIREMEKIRSSKIDGCSDDTNHLEQLNITNCDTLS